jgi:beta-lactamase superfamily II metal-dependent hydrolase
VGKVYAPKTPFNSKEYKNFIKGVKKQNLTITTPAASDIINLGSSTITFLAPINESYADLTNTSIVLRIVCGCTSF